MAWLGHGDCTCNSVALTFSRLGRKGMVMWAVSFSTMRPAGRPRPLSAGRNVNVDATV